MLVVVVSVVAVVIVIVVIVVVDIVIVCCFLFVVLIVFAVGCLLFGVHCRSSIGIVDCLWLLLLLLPLFFQLSVVITNE